MNSTDAIVFVVDDDPSVRKGLMRLLRASGYQVESFESAEAFLQRPTGDHKPACLILDVQMPGLDGLALQQHLVALDSDLPLVFLSGHGDIPMSVKTMKAGAQDFLTKPVDEDVLLTAVSNALKRHNVILDEQDTLDGLRRKIDALTPRELEVLRCVLSGARNKQIGFYLGIAEKTVKVHRGRVMEKMGASSVADLALQCSRIGIIPQRPA